MSAKIKQRISGAFRRIVYPKGSTSLRWTEITVLFFACMCTAMTITMLFPFLPAMVKHFGKTEEETGYYAGLIASAMFFGRFVSSYFWGNLADKFGRRPILIISTFLLGANMLVFGLSTSVAMAILTRFGAGLSSGLIGTAKAIICELCDHTNQNLQKDIENAYNVERNANKYLAKSLGMSAITSAYTTGLIFGPPVGGFLSEVGRKYPRLFPKGSLFERFPFLLPCLINAALLFLSAVIIYVWMPETLIRKKRNDPTKRKEESNSLYFSSLLKKTDGDLTVNIQSENKKCQKCDEVEKINNGKIQEKEYVFSANETHDATTKDQESDKNSLDTNEMAKTPDGEDDVNMKENDMYKITKTSDSLLDVDANKDDSCSTDQSRNNKDSEHATTCTDSEPGATYVTCSTKGDVKGICGTRDSDWIAKRDGECTSGENGVHEEPLSKNQMTNTQDSTEPVKTNSPHTEHTCNSRISTSSPCKACQKKVPNDTSSSTRASNLSSTSCSSVEEPKKLDTVTDSITKRSCFSRWGSRKESNLWRILRNYNAVLSVVVYSLFSLSAVGASELFNIWGATDPRLGGLGFSTDDLGTAILIVGIGMILIQTTILPKLERKFGAILNLQVCVIICLFLVVSQPALRIFRDRPAILWPALLIHLTLMRILVCGVFLSSFLLVNNSVTQDLLCSVNGLALSVCSLFRAFAPSIGGSLFAWSISEGYKIGFPFNMNLAFIFFGFVFLITISLSCFLSESLNNPKERKNMGLQAHLSHGNLLETKA